MAGTPEAFAAGLAAATADADRRTRMGALNRTRARSEFDVREMLTLLEAVYREALGL